MQEKKINRRKKYYIDKDFQAKFIIKFCLLVVSASIVTGVLLYYYNKQTNTVAFENLRVIVKSTSDFILPIVLAVLVIVTIIAAIATILMTLFTSHKISGPLYKLEKELEKMEAGDFSSPIKIRSSDQLQRVALRFDNMRLNIKESLSSIKSNWKDLNEQLKSKKDKSISDSIAKIDEEINKFKTN